MNRWKATALLLAGILVGVVFARPQVSGADGNQQQFKECAVLRLSVKTRKIASTLPGTPSVGRKIHRTSPPNCGARCGQRAPFEDVQSRA